MATHIRGGVSILSAMALCCAVSVFSAEIKKVSTVPVQPKTSVNSTKEQSETKELEAAEKDIADIDSDTRKEAAKALSKLILNKKTPWISYTAKALLADYYIEENELKKAADVLRDCNDYTKIGASKDTDHGTAYLKCFLEYAKLEAAKKNIAEALKMANYAEGKTDGIDKILVYCKYGEILGTPEVNQPENAKKYFEKALKICNEKLKKLGDASVGEAKEDVSAERRSWNKLKMQISEQQQKLQAALLAKEYGGDYSTYYLMMSAFYAKNYIKAQFYANKLIQQNDNSVYGQAARYYHAVCTMNIPETKKSSKVSAGIKTAEAELKKFIKEKPYGDYRGDAWASLGKMELEHNFDAKAAAKYYDEALAWFKYQRDLKNSTDLFVIPDKVKEISKPKGKTASLDKWGRTVYRDLSPLEIITPKSANWVIDEKSKECVFMVGFFHLIDGKPEKAKEYFDQISSLDAEIALLDKSCLPNILMRLRGACEQGFIQADKDMLKKFTGKNKLKLSLADLYLTIEKFDNAKTLYTEVYKSSDASQEELAYALFGQSRCFYCTEKRKEAYKGFTSVYEKFEKTLTAPYAMLYTGMLKENEGKQEVFDIYRKCIDKYPKSPYSECAMARCAWASDCYGNRGMAAKYAEKYLDKYPKGRYISGMNRILKRNKNKKG